jgi:glycogen operon protein
MRNIMATLMLSQGTPMIAHGDEMGRTQHGNNNVYCQDNELAWMDWSLAEKSADLLAFTRRVTQLRKDHPVFRRRRFFEGRPVRHGDEIGDIAWFTPAGQAMSQDDWDSGFDKCIMVFLNGDGIREPDARGERVVDDSFLLCFNAHEDAVEFAVPGADYGQEWTVELDTAEPTEPEAPREVQAGNEMPVAGRSLLVMRKVR